MLSEEKPQHATKPRSVGEILGEEDHGHMFRRALEAVKASVRIEEVVAYYTDARLLGNGRLLARCIAPDHEDRTPSMTIYTDQQKFHCYGCGLHGDVVDMERIAGRHLEAWTAMRALADRHGVELPRRSQRWHKWSVEKRRRHDELREVRTRLYQRRLLRMFTADLECIEDLAEREEEAKRIYADLYPLANAWAEWRSPR
jgi:DNA primase